MGCKRGQPLFPSKSDTISPAHACYLAPRSPRVNWTEALGEVLRDSRKGPKTIVPAKGEHLIWLEKGHLPKVGLRRRRDRLHGEDRDCQITDVPRFARTAARSRRVSCFLGFVLRIAR
jgi:hypothetical protein